MIVSNQVNVNEIKLIIKLHCGLQDALLQWCKEGGVAGELLPLTVPPISTGAKPFCPTKKFRQIGQVPLDHMALLKASLDWQGDHVMFGECCIREYLHRLVECSVATVLSGNVDQSAWQQVGISGGGMAE